ncbi:MAG: PIG-L family deacetylase [Verrucomicrobia bacterium]|nr:PIG-L family deacetylase [Verrucomicrobiota bacterium]
MNLSFLSCLTLALSLVIAPGSLVANEPSTLPAPALRSPIEQDLRAFGELTSVLHIAAHPDDENTHLITYLARGRGYRTGYLSLTRGDGGQNESGPDFGEKLGLARTHELLVARQLDGGHQYFTRALDFGFSKDVNETLRIWDRREVLADVVRVLRTFRPDVVITRFSPEPGKTHGHHTASAVLALEAFHLSGDPAAFPEQLGPGGLTPWQPKRILHNNTPFRPAPDAPTTLAPGNLALEVGGLDPVTNESFGSIAARSRAMHITQGFGNFASATAATATTRRETFAPLAGEPATESIFDGIEPTWDRYPGVGASIRNLADAVIASFDPANPAASAPALLLLRQKLADLPADPVVAAKRTQLDHLLQACLGLSVSTLLPQAEVVPGEVLALSHQATLRSSVPVRWVGLRYPSLNFDRPLEVPLPFGITVTRTSTPTIPPTTPPSQPYWLRAEGTPGLSQVDDPKLIGLPENPPAFPVEFVFEVGGQTLVVVDEPVQIVPDASAAQTRRRLDVIAPVALAFASEVELFAPGSTKNVAVEITAARANTPGTLRLDVPAQWAVSPASQTFLLKTAGEKTRLTFTLTAPSQAASATIRAIADLGGVSFDNQRFAIRYPHLPVLLLQPSTQLRAVSLELATRGKRVGYLPGAGDNTPEALQQMGYTVTSLTGADLTPQKLHGLDAVVIGVRAFNDRTDLADALPGLFAYAEAGGTVIAQYNRPNGLKTETLAPYALSIAGPAPDFRVTDERSPVTFLATEHPALTTPNRLGPADFDGWVQERGAYFPSSWDQERFVSLLAMNDPGENPLTSSVLVARHGRGYFVYTSLAFFRQLPAGVPGAYRLFANLVSLTP